MTFRNTISAALVAAITTLGLGSAPTPAAANDTGAALIAGAVLGGVIVNGINTRHKEQRYYAPAPRARTQGYRRSGYVIPGNCVLDMRTRHGLQTVFLRGCLLQSGFYGRIPANCNYNVKYRGETRTVVSRSCLIRAGYRF